MGMTFNPHLQVLDSSSKQCVGIYPAQLVGGRWPPSPQRISAAPPNAQAAVGVCWYIPAGKGTPAEPSPEGARLPSGSTTIDPWSVVSKCALSKNSDRAHLYTVPVRAPCRGRGVLWTQWGATLPKPLVRSAGKDIRFASALSSEADISHPKGGKPP